MPSLDHDSVFRPTGGQSAASLQDGILNGTWYLRALLDALEKVPAAKSPLLPGTLSGLACIGQEIADQVDEKVMALVRLAP